MFFLYRKSCVIRMLSTRSNSLSRTLSKTVSLVIYYITYFLFSQLNHTERKCETGLVTDSGGQARKRRRLSRLGEIDTNAVLTKRAERDGKDKEGRMNWHGDRGDEGVSVMGVQG